MIPYGNEGVKRLQISAIGALSPTLIKIGLDAPE